jgi:predicted PurR-regulated permease PerM
LQPIINDKDVAGRALLTVFTILLLLFAWPFILPVFWALVIAILLQPIWRKMEERVPVGPVGRGLLILLGITLIVFVPLVLIGLALPAQVNALIDMVPQYQKTFLGIVNNALSYLPPRVAAELQSSFTEQSQANLGEWGKSAFGLFQSAASSTFSMFVNFGVMLYVLFFFLVDGKRIFASVASYLPFSDALTDRMAQRFVIITKASVLGVFVIAVAQGAVAGIIYWILGVQAPVALGIATIVASLIPAVGSGLVWVPVAIFLAVNGQVTQALILLGAGFFVISMVDNLLRPRLVGRSTQIPDWVIMVTTLGGLVLVGGTGIVLGPMVAGLTLSLWQMTRAQPAPAQPQPAVSAVEEAPPKRRTRAPTDLKAKPRRKPKPKT